VWQPIVAGKPYEPFAALVRERVGAELADSLMVGDRPSTDGLMAKRLGVPFGLLLSGVTGADEVPTDPAPTYVGGQPGGSGRRDRRSGVGVDPGGGDEIAAPACAVVGDGCELEPRFARFLLACDDDRVPSDGRSAAVRLHFELTTRDRELS